LNHFSNFSALQNLFSDIYLEKYNMNTEKQIPSESTNLIDPMSDEEKFRAIIKKYSFYSKPEYIHPDCPKWVLELERRNK